MVAKKSEERKLDKPLIDIDWKMVDVIRKDGMSWEEISSDFGITPMQLYRRRKQSGYFS